MREDAQAILHHITLFPTPVPQQPVHHGPEFVHAACGNHCAPVAGLEQSFRTQACCVKLHDLADIVARHCAAFWLEMQNEIA